VRLLKCDNCGRIEKADTVIGVWIVTGVVGIHEHCNKHFCSSNCAKLQVQHDAFVSWVCKGMVPEIPLPT
jgi:hypothetical protein